MNSDEISFSIQVHFYLEYDIDEYFAFIIGVNIITVDDYSTEKDKNHC